MTTIERSRQAISGFDISFLLLAGMDGIAQVSYEESLFISVL